MDSEGSHKLKFCGGGDDHGNLHVKWLTSCHKKTSHSEMREPVSCQDFESEYDDIDDVPFSPRFSPISSFGTCFCKCDASRDITTLPVKRLFNETNSLHISVKKSKVSPYDDHNEDGDEDDILLSNIVKSPRKSADNSFSSLKKEFALVEKLFEECIRKRQVEEMRLQCIKREIEECWKELVNKKKQVSCVRRINEIHDQVLGKVERKEEELKDLTQKVAECNLELKSKEKELDVIKILVGRQAEDLESERKKLLKVISIRQSDPHAQMKDFESMKKQFEGQVKEVERRAMELDSKEMQLQVRENEFKSKQEKFEGQEKELVSKQKQHEVRVKELEFKENQLAGRVKEFESKSNEFEDQLNELVNELVSKQKQHEVRVKEHELKAQELKGQVNELESKKKHFESQVEDFKSKEKQFENRCKEFESKENRFKVKVKELELKEKQIEGQVKELESKMNKFDGQPKESELKGKEYEALKENIDEEKEPDFVENLIKRQQYDEAVRYCRAYYFSYNDQLVGLLEEHVQNLKLISERSCKETNSIEIKDKARDEEVASLIAVLQCIIDNNLESPDLLNKIDNRIIELQRQNGK